MLASAPNLLPLIPLLGTLFGGLCLWATFRAARCQRLVEDIPTSKTTGVFIGDVQRGLAELRSQLAATAPGAQGQPRALANTVQLLAQRYPELAAQRSFADLHDHLVDTEHRIALARGYFNGIATFYNTRLQRVPVCYVARLASLQRQPLLAAIDFQRQPVDAVLVP